MEISEILRHADSEKNAAESHGILCGLQCVSDSDHYSLWEQEVIGGTDISQRDRSTLKGLYLNTREQLSGGNFTFMPLLPDDDASLRERVPALASWCQGFLLGIGLAGVQDLSQYDAEVGEFISDLIEIGRVDDNLPADDDESEQAFTEVVEYIRAGVQLFKEDAQRLHTPSTPSSH